MKKWAREVTLHKVSIHGAHKKKDKCSQDTPPPHTPRNLRRDPSAGGQWAAHAAGARRSTRDHAAVETGDLGTTHRRGLSQPSLTHGSQTQTHARRRVWPGEPRSRWGLHTC